MRRVVITGMGIVSSIGKNTQEVLSSLHEASPHTHACKYKELASVRRSTARPGERRRNDRPPRHALPRRGCRLESHRNEQAIQDPASNRRGLQCPHRHHHGLGRAVRAHHRRNPPTPPAPRGPSASVRLGAKAMSVDGVATARDLVQDQGRELSISSACATSTIASAMHETIQIGKQDVIFAGGCEELDWSLSVLFDAMGAIVLEITTITTVDRFASLNISRDALSSRAAAGVVVLEELEHAKARGGARIYSEVVGYGATSDGYDSGWRRRAGRRALHAHGGLENREDADRLHQPARHLDAGRRSLRRSRRSERCSAPAKVPADLGDQGADRHSPRRHRRARRRSIRC